MRTWTILSMMMWLIAGGAPSLRAEVSPSDKRPYQVITAYLNAEIESLWLLEKDLERLNRDLNRCLERELHQAELSRDVCDLHFISDWLLDRPAARHRDTLYDAALRAIPALPASHQARIRQELEQVRGLLTPTTEWLHALDAYIRQEHYRSDRGFETGYRWLDRLAVCYGDFSSLAGKLHFSLETAWQTMPLAGEPDPYSPALHSLAPVVAYSRALLRAARNEDRKGLEAARQALRQAVTAAQGPGWASVRALPPQPGSQRDPRLRYREVLAQARDLLQLAGTCLDMPSLPAEAEGYGWGYYYHNRFLANKFSRPGASLVAQYNRLLALSPAAGLPQIGEVQVFRTLRPVLPAPTASPPVASISRVTPDLAPPGPQHLVLLLDVSGSMQRPEKLPLVQQMLGGLLPELSASDRVSVVTFSGTSQVLGRLIPATAQDSLQAILATLTVGGNSQPETGAKLAYELAWQDSSAGRRQIVLITDGGFAIAEPLLRLVEAGAYTGTPLNILYVGREPERMAPRLTKLAAVGLGSFGYATPAAALQRLRQVCSTGPLF